MLDDFLHFRDFPVFTEYVLDDRHRNDFFLELATCDGCRRLLVTVDGECILVFARDVIFGCNTFCRMSHAHVVLWCRLHDVWVWTDDVTTHRYLAHRLHTAGDDGRCLTDHDFCRRIRDGLKA